MTQEEIIEYNRMCAEFLGWEQYTNIDERWYGHWKPSTTIEKPWSIRVERLEFHYDWNWIMEVVETIEKKSWVNIKGCAVDISTIANLNAPTKKEAVVEAINQFLIWYEQNKII